MNRIAIAYLSKDRVELSRRTIKSLLGLPVDLFWIDGSSTEEGRAVPYKVSLDQEPGHRIFVHGSIYGGPDAAVAYALTAMLDGGDYDYVGLCESDVLLHDDWFGPTLALFERGASDGLTVGAVSARCFQDRILVQRDGYALMHNLGFGMQIMTREAGQIALCNMRTGWTQDNRRLFCQLSGLDIGTWWAFKAMDHQICGDWNQDRVLAAHGLASLALTPSPVEMIGQEPPLAEQGLKLVEEPFEPLRNDEAFARYVETTRRIRDGEIRVGTTRAIYRDDTGSTLYFPHQIGAIDGAEFTGDWRLKWTQGFGPFAYRAGAECSLTVTVSGPCEFLVAGGAKGGQVLVEDLRSGYSVKPTLPPGDQIMSLVVPCGVSHRAVRLTMLAPGPVFHGLRCRERQVMQQGWLFDHSQLPPV